MNNHQHTMRHNLSSVVPMVVESTGRSERAYDVFSLLLKDRIIFVTQPIEMQMASVIIAQMIYLSGESSEEPIRMYISSPGGEVNAGLAIYDAMQNLAAPVSTIAVGSTHSFGTVLLTAGTEGKRYALPNATIHMHQPLISGGLSGQTSDIEIYARNMSRQRRRMEKILAIHTKQSLEQIQKDTDRDFFLDAVQAREYGLVDEVLGEPWPDESLDEGVFT